MRLWVGCRLAGAVSRCEFDRIGGRSSRGDATTLHVALGGVGSDDEGARATLESKEEDEDEHGRKSEDDSHQGTVRGDDHDDAHDAEKDHERHEADADACDDPRVLTRSRGDRSRDGGDGGQKMSKHMCLW